MRVKMLSSDTPANDAFYRLPERVHAEDPWYLPAGRRAERAEINDPAYADRQALFLVEREAGIPLCRCVARQGEDPSAGTIGFFAGTESFPACRLLLATAEDWLRERGVRRVVGPMNGDTWHAYRFATGPRGVAPFFKEPWNPDYAPVLWEECGYRVVDRYHSSRIVRPSVAAENLAPTLRRVERRGYGFRPFRRNRFEEDLELLHRLSLRIFEGNRHYTPLSLEGFLRLYQGARSILVPRLCQFCLGPEGEEIGFVFCYPDVADAVRAMRGGRGPVAKLRFLARRRHAARVCIKSLGCLPEARGVGVGPALMGLAFRESVALGYGEVLMCLMHEANASTRLDGGASEPFRHYVLYEKEL